MGIILEWIADQALYPEVLIKISVALLLSLIIGVEREIRKKPIGLKTSAVIATFSCLLTIVSIESAYLVPARNDINVTMDPLRLAAQVVSGIGFLGAGAILRKGNDTITGLTTAAMIWGAASIGIAVGAGFYVEAAFAVVRVMFVVEVLAPILAKFGPKRLRSKEVPCILVLSDKSNITDVLAYLENIKMTVEQLKIRQIVDKDQSIKHEMDLRLSTTSEKPIFQFYNDLDALPYIESIEIEIIK